MSGFYDQHGTWIPQAISSPASAPVVEAIAAFEREREQLVDVAELWNAAADVYDVWREHGSYGCWKWHADQASMRLAQRATARQAAIEREVELEEQMNADLIEREQLRGIVAPDW